MKKKKTNKNEKHTLTRKEALKKMGKYAALTSIATFTILDPKRAQAMSSEPPPPGSEDEIWDALEGK